MVTFRNNSNNRRSNFRRNDRNFKSNGERKNFSTNFSNNDNFKRKSPGRNNHNAPKLIEKYNDLAREALSNGDKILSENYTTCNHLPNVKEKVLEEKLLDNKSEIDLDIVDDNSNNSEQTSDKDAVNVSKDDANISTTAKSRRSNLVNQ